VRSEMSNIEAAVEEYASSLRDRLSSEVVELSVKREGTPTGRGIVLTLSPRNRNSARVEIYAVDDDPFVTLRLGRSTIIEVVPANSVGYVLRSVRDILKEVVAGRFREELWIVDGEVRRCFGHIAVDGSQQTFRYFSVGRSASGVQESIVVNYAPFDAAVKLEGSVSKLPQHDTLN
jgi:hypothetical protein